MAELPSIVVHHPLPNNIVDDPIQICGISTTFEANLQIRALDNNGNQVVQQFFTTRGSNGIWANFSVNLPLGTIPATTLGTLEVFEISAKDGSEINKVTIPIVFGRALIDPYIGFAQYTVVSGDTLSKIAQQFYNDSTLFSRIFDANRDQLSNPNQIVPGQVLRIPQ